MDDQNLISQLKEAKNHLSKIKNAIISENNPELKKGARLVSIIVELLHDFAIKDHASMDPIYLFLWYFKNSSVKRGSEREGEDILIITPSVSNLKSRNLEYFWYSLNKKGDIFDKTKDLRIHSVELKNILIKVASIHFPDFFEEEIVVA